MHPVFSAEDEAFRQELRDFYRQELPDDWYGMQGHESEQATEVIKNVRKKLADKGWLTMAWPKEYGGQEASITRQLVFSEESANLPGYYRRGQRDGTSVYTRDPDGNILEFMTYPPR